MGKLKDGICPGCNERLLRHDTVRVQVKVAEGANGSVFQEAHLGCAQDKKLEIRKAK